MIFMGIDTSGDHDVTTPYVLSLVISNDSKSIEESNLGECIKEIRNLLGKENYVLHATNDSEKVRKSVVQVIEKYDIKSMIIVVLDRVKVNKKSLGKILKGVVNADLVVYDNEILDGVKIARKMFKVSLSKHGKSPISIPLQIADYFSYYWWELFSGKLKDVNSFEKILSMTIKIFIVGYERELTFVNTSLSHLRFNAHTY